MRGELSSPNPSFCSVYVEERSSFEGTSQLYNELVLLQVARGSAYIVPSNESGPSDQTDID